MNIISSVTWKCTGKKVPLSYQREENQQVTFLIHQNTKLTFEHYVWVQVYAFYGISQFKPLRDITIITTSYDIEEETEAEINLLFSY